MLRRTAKDVFIAYCVLIALICLCVLRQVVNSECVNACSGHGKCTTYDMCICDRNWMSVDCKDRVCPFGRSVVDTPKGDLDGSGKFETFDDNIVYNEYTQPFGLSEQVKLLDSDGNSVYQSSHSYSECSSAGKCNRQTGECECYEGLEGVSCQYLSCPRDSYGQVCSGHGICQTLQWAAYKDGDNTYNLWDKQTSKGCFCDPDYHGSDCSLRKCPIDIDPLYLDDVSTVQMPVYFLAIVTTSSTRDFNNGRGQGVGQFKIKISDKFGKDYLTPPIEVGATCDQIITALESIKIPNILLKIGMIECEKSAFIEKDPVVDEAAWNITFYTRYNGYFRGRSRLSMEVRPAFWLAGYNASSQAAKGTDDLLTGDIYRLMFLDHPGRTKEPELVTHFNGAGSTIGSHSGKVATALWSNGQHPESFDHFPKHCNDAQVQIQQTNGVYFIGDFLKSKRKHYLMECLGDVDGDPNTYAPGYIYKWDYGSKLNPHLIRLVRAVTDMRDGGFYAAIYYDPTISLDDTSIPGTFVLLNPFELLDIEGYKRWNQRWEIFATDGTLMADPSVEAFFDFGSKTIYTTNTSMDWNDNYLENSRPYENRSFGSVDCNTKNSYYCMKKGDGLVLLDPNRVNKNPNYFNLYYIENIRRNDRANTMITEYNYRFPEPNTNRVTATSSRVKNIITVDKSTNWAQDTSEVAKFAAYRFRFDRSKSYEYVAECSNRGICNSFEGSCECFNGYLGIACEQIAYLDI